MAIGIQENQCHRPSKAPWREWTSNQRRITIYCQAGNGAFSADVQDHRSGETFSLQSDQIKCGILGNILHPDFIQKVDQLAREKIRDSLAVFTYPPEGRAEEVWIFEAIKAVASLIKKGKEILKQLPLDDLEKATAKYQEVLGSFETALKIQERQHADPSELRSAISQIKKELFLFRMEHEAPLYLSPEQVPKLNGIIDRYRGEDDIFSCLSAYLEAFENSDPSPSLRLIAALLDEHSNNPISAAQHYLVLAESHPNPLPSIQKAESLIIKDTKDPFAYPHFLEKLDRDQLVGLNRTIEDPDLQRWLLHKDAVRMAFEECLLQLHQRSPQPQAPTCFICFNVEEHDVGQWLEHILVPDLDKIGIKPLFCFRDLGSGKELNAFQGLIRGADQVIIVCTSELKRKCDERKKAPTGVAQEIRIAQERYNDPDKYETIFPLYLKGTRQSSCPSVFFEPIFGTRFTFLDKSTEASVFSYYANAFELLGGMRKIPREGSRAMKEAFLSRVQKIVKGEINLADIERWRQERLPQHERLSETIQERVSKSTQMINLPLPPQDFTGREQELKALHETCRHKHRVAITGLGGIGKTALALKYGNAYKSHYQFIHFMPAENSQLIREGLLKLADDLHVPKTDKVEERLEWLKTTLDRLEYEYLLIFDGIDQVEAFQEMEKRIPKRGRCLLLTSRMPGQSSIRSFEVIELYPFSIEEAVSYLLIVTGSKEQQEAQELAEKLGRLPLALTHAARYIREQGISIQEYIKRWNEYAHELLQGQYFDLTPEERTVFTTWTISMNAIEQIHRCPLAKEVMEFLSFLGQAPIPLSLIEEWFRQIHPHCLGLELGNALRHLCGYSMLDSHSPNHYLLHLLVQDVTRYQIPSEKKQKAFEEALATLDTQIERVEEDDPTTWSPAKLCVPHAIALCGRHHLIANVDLKNQGNFMIRLGILCRFLGQYTQQALTYLQKVLEIYRKTFGEDHTDTAMSYNNVGMSLRNLGRHVEALPYLQKALKIYRKTFGEDHPNTADSYNDVGASLRDLGWHTEALEYVQQALEIRRKTLGEDHPCTAASYNNVGMSLRDLGRHVEALKYEQKALEICRRELGEDHPCTAASYNNVGSSLRDLGRHAEALEYLKRALELCRKTLGEDHPDTAMSYNNVGLSLQDLGRHAEALPYLQKALKIYRKTFEEDHPTIAMSYNNIGMNLRDLVRHAEALEYLQKALEIYRKTLGEDHPTTAISYNNVGLSLQDLGRHAEALEYLQKALEIRRKIVGEDHADTIRQL